MDWVCHNKPAFTPWSTGIIRTYTVISLELELFRCMYSWCKINLPTNIILEFYVDTGPPVYLISFCIPIRNSLDILFKATKLTLTHRLYGKVIFTDNRQWTIRSEFATVQGCKWFSILLATLIRTLGRTWINRSGEWSTHWSYACSLSTQLLTYTPLGFVNSTE